MNSKPTTKIVLGKRQLNSGIYPVQLRVTYDGQPRYYGIKMSISEIQFQKSYCSPAPRDSNLTLKNQLLHIEAKAQSLIDEMEEFTFKEFRNKFMGKAASNAVDVISGYDQIIANVDNQLSLNTIEIYKLSKRSLIGFLGPNKSKLPFNKVTPEFIRSWENYMKENQGLKLTTISMYLRNLRTVINNAIKKGILPYDKNPFKFGERPFKIPQVRNNKRSLSFEQLQALIRYEDFKGSPRIKARDFFMLSFYLYGINITDLLHLKNGDLQDGTLAFTRRKTLHASRANQKNIVIHIDTKAMTLINKHRNENADPDAFLFKILSADLLPAEIRRRTKNFTRFINQHLQTICANLNFQFPVSTYYARHSFATLARDRNIPTSKIAEMLGHSNELTTQNYLNSLNLDDRKNVTMQIFGDLA